MCVRAKNGGDGTNKNENIEKKKHTLKRAALYHFIKQYKVVVVCVCVDGWCADANGIYEVHAPVWHKGIYMREISLNEMKMCEQQT